MGRNGKGIESAKVFKKGQNNNGWDGTKEDALRLPTAFRTQPDSDRRCQEFKKNTDIFELSKKVSYINEGRRIPIPFNRNNGNVPVSFIVSLIARLPERFS